MLKIKKMLTKRKKSNQSLCNISYSSFSSSGACSNFQIDSSICSHSEEFLGKIVESAHSVNNDVLIETIKNMAKNSANIISNHNNSSIHSLVSIASSKRSTSLGLNRQLAHYPRTENGALHERPRVANYCRMDHAGGADMAYEYKRLETFKNWPDHLTFIKPEDLAKAGFFFDRSYSEYNDRVKCAFCRGVLHSWEKGDEPIKEHRRAFSTCPFVISMNVGNIPITGKGLVPDFYCNNVASDQFSLIVLDNETVNFGGPQVKRCNAQYLVFRSREISFKSLSGVSRQLGKQFASAGFYYTGKGDTIKCYKCHFEASIWDPHAEKQHETNIPMCPYIQGISKERKMITFNNLDESASFLTPKLSDSEIATRKDSWAVRQAIHLGFDIEIVHYVVNQYQHFSGEQVTILTELVADIQQLEEDMKKSNIDTSNISLALMAWNDVLEQRQQDYNNSIREKNERLVIKIQKNPDFLKEYWDDPDMAVKFSGINKDDLSYQEQLNENLKKDQQCSICMDHSVDMVFIPCYHIVTCSQCSNSLSQCPICRSPIESAIQANLK